MKGEGTMALTNAEKCARYRATQKGKEAQARHEAMIERFQLALHIENDADILAALDPNRPKAEQFKEWIRLGMKAKK